ncbi:IS66 family insertion sequence element accessory protein TnpA [Sorangium sp. So ce117]|uniref:IS66 family insertion sequence element accessory protein TnpA n=1 Tax=Sorangium sp. So ce117 TaxID=3133277 RepID=UPI003F5EAAF5
MDESRRIWRDRVARWHKSGQSARVFAELEGVNAGTLDSWSRRLGMKRSGYRRRSEKATLPALLPVVVAPSSATACSSGTALEIVFPDGAVVRVPPTFDEDTLTRRSRTRRCAMIPGRVAIYVATEPLDLRRPPRDLSAACLRGALFTAWWRRMESSPTRS